MTNTLFSLTAIVDYVGMGISLWLAFYLLARGFPSRVTIRAVVVLLALSVFFLSASLNLFIQEPGTTAIRATMLVVGLSAWCDLTQKFIQPAIHGNKNWMVVAIYALGFVTVVLLLGTHDVFVSEQSNLLWVGRMNLGIQYSVYAVFLWCASISILYNLYWGRKSRAVQPNIHFVIASFLVVGEVVYGSLALVLTRPSPRIVQDALIASSVIFLGISVARHQTLVERRSSLYELPIHSLVIVILVGIYAALAWQWSHSEVIVILISTLAILTHSVYGLVGEILTQMVSKRESDYRHQLRHLGQNLPDDVTLQTRLEDGLKLLCQILGATGGFIATRQSDLLVVTVSFRSIPLEEKFAPIELTSDDAYEPSAEYADTLAWMMPAFKDAEQLALIGIGHPIDRHHYSADDIDLLAEAANRVALIVALSGAHSEEKTLQSESDGLISTLITNPDPKFLKMVEEGLRNLTDVITLGQSPLAQELGITGKTHIDQGKALRQKLTEAIETLRPEGPRPKELLPREWENYVVLHDAYIEGVPNREIMARLYTSEGTFNRIRRKALRGVARYLLENTN